MCQQRRSKRRIEQEQTTKTQTPYMKPATHEQRELFSRKKKEK